MCKLWLREAQWPVNSDLNLLIDMHAILHVTGGFLLLPTPLAVYVSPQPSGLSSSILTLLALTSYREAVRES